MLAALQLAACSAQPAASGQPRRVAITTFWDGSLSYECALPLWCQSAVRLSAVLPEALAPEVVLIAPKPSPECPQARRRAMLAHASRGLRTVRTSGAGQLAPGPHARHVRRTRPSFGRAVRTAYRVVHHHRLVWDPETAAASRQYVQRMSRTRRATRAGGANMESFLKDAVLLKWTVWTMLDFDLVRSSPTSTIYPGLTLTLTPTPT